jgi:hypothetical protein
MSLEYCSTQCDVCGYLACDCQVPRCTRCTCKACNCGVVGCTVCSYKHRATTNLDRLHRLVITGGNINKRKRIGSIQVCTYCIRALPHVSPYCLIRSHMSGLHIPTWCVVEEDLSKESINLIYLTYIRSFAALVLKKSTPSTPLHVLAIALQCRKHAPQVLKTLTPEQQVKLDFY